MNPGEIIYQGKSEKDRAFIIRYIEESDAQAMCDYINELSKEQTFIHFQGEQISLEEEIKYLEDQLGKLRKGKSVHLLALSENKLIGISSIGMREKTESHIGGFGISLNKDFRDEGIGSKLMEVVLQEAEKNLPSLKIVILGVYAANSRALEMYKKFGFIQYGLLPKGIFYKGKYIDGIDMYKVVREF